MVTPRISYARKHGGLLIKQIVRLSSSLFVQDLTYQASNERCDFASIDRI